MLVRINLVLCVALVAVVVLLGSAPVANATNPYPSLCGYWPLTDTSGLASVAESANSLSSTITNYHSIVQYTGPSQTLSQFDVVQGYPGALGTGSKGFYFNNLNATANETGISILDPTSALMTSGGQSLSIWFQTASSAWGTNTRIMQDNESGSTYGYEFDYGWGTAPNQQYNFGNLASSGYRVEETYTNNGGTIYTTAYGPGSWNLITATINGTALAVYENGVLLGTGSSYQSGFVHNTGATNISILGSTGNGNVISMGLDDAANWGITLTAAEAKALYTAPTFAGGGGGAGKLNTGYYGAGTMSNLFALWSTAPHTPVTTGDGLTWNYINSNFPGGYGAGQTFYTGGYDYIQLDGTSGVYAQITPEPGTLALLAASLLGLLCYAWRKRR